MNVFEIIGLFLFKSVSICDIHFQYRMPSQNF